MVVTGDRRLFKEYYLDNNDRLLDHIVDLGVDEIQEHIDTSLRGFVNHNSAAANGTHSLAHEIDVDL